jgi:hypothetical protein
MIELNFPDYPFKFRQEGTQRLIFDSFRKKYVVLTPEEWVRQNVLVSLCESLGYPRGLISVEKEIKIGALRKRYDVVVYDRQQQPWMLVECKEPGTAVSEKVLQQLLRYHQILQCPFWMLTNGMQHFCAENREGKVSWLNAMPQYL